MDNAARDKMRRELDAKTIGHLMVANNELTAINTQLVEVNKQLAAENARLKTQLADQKRLELEPEGAERNGASLQ